MHPVVFFRFWNHGAAIGGPYLSHAIIAPDMIERDTAEPVKHRTDRRLEKLIICCLVVISLAVFLQTTGFGFVNFDDGSYVYNNSRVTAGLSLPGLFWALTTFHEANWHPLTWLSLMADASLSGFVAAFGIELGNPDAGVYHLTNVVLHTANVLLLFVLLNSMTRMRWRSAFVAALFAVHPLHVESVAWVSERKDVLSTLFLLLTMLAYLRYVAAPTRARYARVAVVFALGLMAKPMLVTLPILLLLIDFWPLGRLRETGPTPNTRSAALLLLEKWPLFLLSLCSCGLTFWAQRAGGAVIRTEWFPFVPRLINAIVSYGDYALRMVWPVDLGVFYPMRLAIPTRTIVLASAFVIACTVLAVRCARHWGMGWVTFGWFWYIITMIPVIGLVQVGMQAMADRYTYVPLIGLFVIVAWGVPAVAERLTNRNSLRSAVLASLGAMAVIALGVQGYVQAAFWKDSPTLFGRALEVTGVNYFAEVNYASALVSADRLDEAMEHYRIAAKLKPQESAALVGIGTVLTKKEAYAEAEVYLRRAVKLAPGDAKARNNLGGLLLYQGKAREAAEQFEKALEIQPDYEGARTNLDAARGMLDYPQ